MLKAVNLADSFAQFNDTWNPKIAGEVNDMYVKLAKFTGEFVWHSHEVEDELFLVVSGRLRMQLRDRDVLVGPGEFVVVPHGVEHCPVADEPCEVILLEPRSTLNTGDVDSERTVRDLDRLAGG